LEHIKIALRTKCCLFTKQEMSFIRTSCQILGIDSQATMKAIQGEIESNKIRASRKVMEHLQTRLKELEDRPRSISDPHQIQQAAQGRAIRWGLRHAA
jgi:hypothetical protein